MNVGDLLHGLIVRVFLDVAHMVFDALFRANLEVVWWFAGAEPPDDIRSPLMDPQRVAASGNRIGAMLPGSGERYG